MAQSAQRQELAQLAESLRETALRLRKAAKLLAADQTHEQLKSSHAHVKPSKNGQPAAAAEPASAKPANLKSAAKIKKVQKPKAKKRSGKKHGQK